jgi:flagellar motility protein MotE (MotC chaperone)
MKIKNPIFLLFFCSLLTISFPAPLTAAEKQKEAAAQETPAKPPETHADESAQEKTFSSVEERRLYNTLEKERAGLQEKIKVLADKEKELKTLEQEVDKKFEQMDAKLLEIEKKTKELKKVQQKTEELLAQKDQARQKKIQEASKIYAKMAPDKAAQALSALNDQQLAADIIADIATVKAKSAAKIMEQLDKIKASSLTTTLSTLPTE